MTMDTLGTGVPLKVVASSKSAKELEYEQVIKEYEEMVRREKKLLIAKDQELQDYMDENSENATDDTVLSTIDRLLFEQKGIRNRVDQSERLLSIQRDELANARWLDESNKVKKVHNKAMDSLGVIKALKNQNATAKVDNESAAMAEVISEAAEALNDSLQERIAITGGVSSSLALGSTEMSAERRDEIRAMLEKRRQRSPNETTTLGTTHSPPSIISSDQQRRARTTAIPRDNGRASQRTITPLVAIAEPPVATTSAAGSPPILVENAI